MSGKKMSKLERMVLTCAFVLMAVSAFVLVFPEALSFLNSVSP